MDMTIKEEDVLRGLAHYLKDNGEVVSEYVADYFDYTGIKRKVLIKMLLNYFSMGVEDE